MADDLGRLALGLPVAALLPSTIPLIDAGLPRMAIGVAYAALVLAPYLDTALGLLLLLLVVLTVVSTTSWDSLRPRTARLPLPLVGSAVLLIVVAVLVDPDQAVDSLEDFLYSDAVSIVASGALAATFLSGSAISGLLKPFAKVLKDHEKRDSGSDLERAGTLIGWLERVLLYAFVVGGAPEAAPIALAAKSFARFPSLSSGEEGFAEYFLIGSLASITAAAMIGFAIRGCLGEPLF